MSPSAAKGKSSAAEGLKSPTSVEPPILSVIKEQSSIDAANETSPSLYKAMVIDEEDKDESVVHDCKHEIMPRHEISIEDGEDLGRSLPLQRCEAEANTSSRTHCLNSKIDDLSKKDTERIADQN